MAVTAPDVTEADRARAADAHFGDWRTRYASMASAFSLWIHGDRLQTGTEHIFEPAVKLARAFAAHRVEAVQAERKRIKELVRELRDGGDRG